MSIKPQEKPLTTIESLTPGANALNKPKATMQEFPSTRGITPATTIIESSAYLDNVLDVPENVSDISDDININTPESRLDLTEIPLPELPVEQPALSFLNDQIINPNVEEITENKKPKK